MMRPARLFFSAALFGGLAWADGQPRVAWDPQTLRLIERDGAYGRMLALPDATLLFVCERRGRIGARWSRDRGATWSVSQDVAEWEEGALANPELLLLNDGAVLCFSNRRPAARVSAAAKPSFAILVSRLAKGASAWSRPTLLYEAGGERENGCWEPAAVQLPSGEIQLFFANEAPYRASDEQQITLLRSSDGGTAWDAPERVGFRAGHRDGMPVPLVLNDGSGIAVAIEDNGLGGTFKPAILFTSLADAWHSGTVTGEHPGRWGACVPPLPARSYAGAPYLRQLATGETVLSFQLSEDGAMAHSRTAVCVGDARAKGFGGLTYPFPETPEQAQLWAALCVTDAQTVKVLATVTIKGVKGVWSIDGQVERKKR